MLGTGFVTPGQLSRGPLTAGCAVATTILVCGFVAPSVEPTGIRSEVRSVQLASLNGVAANPLGVLVGALPGAVAAAENTAPAVQPPAGGPADVATAVQSIPDPQAADMAPDMAADVAAAAVTGPGIGTWFMSLLLQPLLWLVQLLPNELSRSPEGYFSSWPRPSRPLSVR